MLNIVTERVNKWKDKLIDLSKRNRLLNFRPTKVTTIHVTDELPPEVFKMVVLENEIMKFLPSDSDDSDKTLFDTKESNTSKSTSESHDLEDYDENKIDEKHKDNCLQTELPDEQLQKNLFRISSKASSVMEEQGYNVLFLALGCLEWFESKDSSVKLKAPILLVPVELKRKSVKSPYKLSYTDELPLLNPALIVRLANDFNVKISPLKDELENISPPDVFQGIRDAVKGFEGWRVTNDIYLSLFSFAKFVMYKDLDTNLKVVLENDIIKTICGQESNVKVSLDILCEPKEVENNLQPSKTFQILDADSSQQQAIVAIKRGGSLLIEGPPGTGKSQTIANIIAESLAENKKVLFVSQKMAALEVVKKRLDNAKLGDYCLELHSRKTDKKEVIKELSRVLELEKKPDHNHDDDLLKLEKTREELNAYVKELHMPCGKLAMTPYQVFGVLSSHADLADLAFVFKNSKEWDRKKYNKCCDLLSSLAHNLSNVHNPAQHPWNGSKITELTYEDKLKIIEIMELVASTYMDFKGHTEKLAYSASFLVPTSINDIVALLDAAKLIIDSPNPPKSVLQNKRWNSLGADISDTIETVKQFNKFKEDIKSKFDIAIISYDIQPLLSRYKDYAKYSFYFLFKPIFWKDAKAIKQCIQKEYKPTIKGIVQDLESINNGKNAAEKIDSLAELGNELFADRWRGRDTNWEALDEFSKWIIKFRQHVIEKHFTDKIFDGTSKDKIDKENCNALVCSVSGELAKLKYDLDNLFTLVKFDELQGFGANIEKIPLENIYKKLINMQNTLGNVDVWIRYQNSLLECESEGLGDFVNKIIQSYLSYEKIVATFKVQFLKSWLGSVFAERPTLKQFYGQYHEVLIAKFRDLDKKQIELAKIRIQHLLSGNVMPFNNASKNSQLGILQRESRKMRAHMPIRKLFKEIPGLISALKPCLMMSPLTVAQFLDPSLYKFDLIIFDEASQIPPEDSIGSIIRGKQIVVAGDSKQLPPTSFFQSEVLSPEDEESDFEEFLPIGLDSILDECAVSKFPKTMLRWHYRSRHEALIAFSNKNLYENRLNTFPCPEEESKDLGVKFNYLPNTFYDRGLSGANIEEAKEVAKAVFEHFKKYPNLSLGVGTFSIRQKYAIDDAIEDMLRSDNTLEPFFAQDRLEHFFVKNLETIQGDERDVIFLSIGYGKDNAGRLSMNFGPINKVGGERRLNVLITRARLRLEVFSSIKGLDFDLSKTESRGVHLLKKYLDYAEQGKSAMLQETEESIDGLSDSPFEEAVYDALISKGINIRKQVGCSGYKIDLAVVDDNNPGRYTVGIECDGANYHSCATARDRDRLRQYVLEDLGWTIIRVWSTDWFKNPKRELDRLLNNIKKTEAGELKKKLNKPQYDFKYKVEIKTPFRRDNSFEVCAYKLDPIPSRPPSRDFYETPTSKIAEILTDVVNQEGPIHIDEAAKRVVQHWGIASAKSRIREILASAERSCVKAGLIKKRGSFYWPKDMDKPKVRFRDLEGVSKDIELVAPEEVAEAACIILKREFSMPISDLISQTAKLIGISRTSEVTSKYILRSINSYKKNSKIIEIDGKLSLKVTEQSYDNIFNNTVDKNESKKSRTFEYEQVVECSYCRGKMRVPIDKGKLKIVCPRCNRGFRFTPGVGVERLYG